MACHRFLRWLFATAVVAVFPVLEHPSPEAASATATITINAMLSTGYTGSDTLWMYVVGPWTQRLFNVASDVPAAGATLWTPPPFSLVGDSALTGARGPSSSRLP